MALPILDGNQSATTLSSILTSGEHIPAHTVVSLGTQAITDISGAVSGSVVSISNFPATQPVSIASVTVGNTVTIAGTVTANPTGTQTIAGTVTANLANVVTLDSFWETEAIKVTGGNGYGIDIAGVDIAGNRAIFDEGGGIPVYPRDNVAYGASFPISGTVTVGSLPAISGTVTANTVYATNVTGNAGLVASTVTAIPVALVDRGVYGGNIMSYDGSNTSLNINVKGSLPSLAAGTAQIGSVTASISNSVTIASLPAISGTVTANTFALQGTAVTTSDFTSTTDSTVLANYNASREVLTIFNEGAGNLHICAGATCTTIAYQVRLSAGDYYEVPNHQTTITHSAVFATAGTARVTEVS
jgi:hypothetical protein